MLECTNFSYEESIICSSSMLSLHLGCDFAFLSFVLLMKSSFHFCPCLDGLILCNGNVFGHASLILDFLVIDLDNSFNNNFSFDICLTF